MVRFKPFVSLPVALSVYSLVSSVGAAAISRDTHGKHLAGGGSSNLGTRQASSGGTFWLGSIDHRGISAFGPSGYEVFRNVKDYGALGDGVTDDTAAIQSAIASGARCGQGCVSDTTTPALVYFPPGTYLISSSIFDYYQTHIVGDANDLPVLKASASFPGGYLIDGDPYFTSELNWPSTTVFFRTIRNFIIDLTAVPTNIEISGIHWPTAQATSLQNIVFEMSTVSGNKQTGIFCESGSAGFMGDLIFNGGKVGAALGNQQFTMRNLTFNNAVTAINHYWNWGWTYKSISINNCQVGIDMSSGGHDEQAVGSITLFDSAITDTPVGILTARDSTSQPVTAGSVILENVSIQNVPVVIQGPGGTTSLAGTNGVIDAWGQGHRYTPSGPQSFQGTFTSNSRPAGLVRGNGYYEKSKPQYASESVASFLSARSAGAAGDGTTDDTNALQSVINEAATSGKIVFVDAGTYRITQTLQIPAGSRIIGEALPVIMSSGAFFNDMNNPKPVIRVGEPGQSGRVEWSDMIVSTQGAQAGAILIEWNLASSANDPSGMWEVHARVGGFAGSNLQTTQCLATPGTVTASPKTECIAAYMLMHITSGATGLYMENTWFWVADHDIDGNGQITIYSGRGLYVESTEGNIWLSGTSVEHNVLYQYQFANTKNIYMGQIQTESAYYQPNPEATSPFPVVESLNDPDFETSCAGESGNCAVGWGLRVIDSTNLLVYGAGLYSFFINNDASCSAQDSGTTCQNSIFSVEGSSSISVYNLNTIGSDSMIDIDGSSIASYTDNGNVFNENIALFRNS